MRRATALERLAHDLGRSAYDIAGVEQPEFLPDEISLFCIPSNPYATIQDFMDSAENDETP